MKLQAQLRNAKGKKVYGYLQPHVKETVDRIVAELAKNPVLKKMYAEWCELEQQKYETYTSAVQKFPPPEENKVFKPVKNAVIRAVLEIDFADRNFTEHEDLDMTVSNEYDSGDCQRNTTVNNAITSLLLTFGRLISDDYNRSARGMKLRTEHKLKAAIRRKKQALGLKENPLENPQFKEG